MIWEHAMVTTEIVSPYGSHICESEILGLETSKKKNLVLWVYVNLVFLGPADVYRHCLYFETLDSSDEGEGEVDDELVSSTLFFP